MNTLERNKLIAEFMGIHEIMLDEYSNYEIDDIYPILGIEPHHHKGLIIHESDLQFHASWEWLMPVVEKIEDDERFDVEILQYGTLILCNQEEIVNNVANISFDKKIKHTYKAVVEFIKWYNDNK